MSGNPSAWNPGTLDPLHAREFRRFTHENNLRPVFLHAPYLINLSCRQGSNASLYGKSIKLLQASVDRAGALGCEYVVVHMGSRKGYADDVALEALAEGICRLEWKGAGEDFAEDAGGGGEDIAEERQPPMLLLENGAGTGDSVGAGFQELADALREAEARGAELPLGICLDTAHMWGAGHDLTSAAAIKMMVDSFDEIVGLGRLHLIHLNDSPVERGACRDRHEHLGHGLIPLEALKAVVRDPRLERVAMILETPGKSNPTNEQRMADLRALAGVSQLPTL